MRKQLQHPATTAGVRRRSRHQLRHATRSRRRMRRSAVVQCHSGTRASGIARRGASEGLHGRATPGVGRTVQDYLTSIFDKTGARRGPRRFCASNACGKRRPGSGRSGHFTTLALRTSTRFRHRTVIVLIRGRTRNAPKPRTAAIQPSHRRTPPEGPRGASALSPTRPRCPRFRSGSRLARSGSGISARSSAGRLALGVSSRRASWIAHTARFVPELGGDASPSHDAIRARW